MVRPATVSLCLLFLAACAPNPETEPDIVGGQLVEETDPIFRSTVSLDDGFGLPVCTGFLFDRRTVVTAAHCLVRVPATVTFGTKDGERISVPIDEKKVRRHEHFNVDAYWSGIPPPSHPSWRMHDIGVIRLKEDAPRGAKVLPLKRGSGVQAGCQVVLAGFGHTRNPQEAYGELRRVTTLVEEVNEPAAEIIFGDPERVAASCSGDSGGPMFFLEEDGDLAVLGITSRIVDRESACVNRGVYTDVRKYEDWIKETSKELDSAAGG